MLTPVTTRPDQPQGRTSPVDMFRFEWAKLHTVRSTWFVLTTVLAVAILVGCIVCAAAVADWSHLTAAERAHFDPTLRSLSGLFFGELAVGVLGVLVITSENATGLIRSTFAAVPWRRAVLAAKAVAVAIPVLVVGTAASVSAFLAGQAFLAGKGIGVSLGAPGELRAVIGGGLYLTLLALLALGLGVIARSTAGGISVFVGLVMILPILISPLPGAWGRDLSEYLPANAGQAILNVHHSASALPPWVGLGVLAAWAAAALLVAGRLIARRDVQ